MLLQMPQPNTNRQQTSPYRQNELDIESNARGRKRLGRLAHFLDDVLKRFGFRGFLESEPLEVAGQAVHQAAFVSIELG
jgi:hypothetical protein